ncbi:MAG: ABC transporter permease [bacterium]|nr:ABC transporter permease [bacterium]
MNKGFYTKLAVTNIKKNSKTYIPYIITCTITIMMFYIMKSLSKNPGIEQIIGDQTLYTVLTMGSILVGAFSLIFLFYTNSFLMKGRKKELGLFNILGMEKRHLAKVILLENIIVMTISLTTGIVFGIALDKAMFLLIAKMVGVKTPLGFFISYKVIRSTILFFVFVFLLILIKSIYTLHSSNPAELLKGGNVGEKEPKTRWFMTLLGTLGMATGYYLAITTKNPISSLYLFFIAVLLVIVSTYLLFTAGSIALLKLLRKKKSYYYQTRHFISISGMIYRMKQNAVGLANICILSTMVLVMVSSTVSMMAGFEDILTTRYPNDFGIYSGEKNEKHNEQITTVIGQVAKETNLTMKNEISYSYLNISAIRHGNTFITDPNQIDYMNEMTNINVLVISTLEDYNRIMGEQQTLNKGEILIFSNRDNYSENELHIFDRKYTVSKVLDDFYENGEAVSNIASTHYVVVSDRQELAEINAQVLSQKENLGLGDKALQFYYGFDTIADKNTQLSFNKQMKEKLSELGFSTYSESRMENKAGMLGIYGGLFFLGIFMGTLFIMATVLIIYYKQISEGYEDRERFAIMQKVGLSKMEVRSAIRSQVLTVFFLPLMVAGIHLLAAFPLISKVLSLLNMMNTRLYIICIASCFLVFAIVYVCVYTLTAKIYYKIVSSKE